MNSARVAALHRQIAKLHEELAAELSCDSEAAPAETNTPPAAAIVPPPKRARSKPRLVRPAGENDELAAAKAHRFLRNNGLRQVNR